MISLKYYVFLRSGDVSGNVSTGWNLCCLYIFEICVLLPIVFLTVKDDL